LVNGTLGDNVSYEPIYLQTGQAYKYGTDNETLQLGRLVLPWTRISATG
jgi:hypothetical protein